MCDSCVANSALLFPFLDGCHLCVHVDEIVDLHQVDSVFKALIERCIDCIPPALPLVQTLVAIKS